MARSRVVCDSAFGEMLRFAEAIGNGNEALFAFILLTLPTITDVSRICVRTF